MGIKQLNKLIQTLAPEACEIKRTSDFAWQIFAIDVSNFMYQFAYNAQEKKPNSHLAGFFQLIHELAVAKIMPLMIFDGAPDQAKDHILAQRQDEKNRKLTKIAELQTTVDKLSLNLKDLGTGNPPGSAVSASEAERIKQLSTTQAQLDKTDKQIIEISHQMWIEVRDLFKLMGVPVLDASGEADILASQLCLEGKIAGIISEDMDHLVFGATTLIRDFNNKRSPDLRVYSQSRLLECLGISSKQFIHLGILCGCDYTPKITGIAWKRAYDLIKAHNDIPTILDLIKTQAKGFSNFRVPPGFDYQSAESLFQSSDPVAKSDDLLEKLKPGQFQAIELRTLLVNSCRYRETTLDPKFQIIESFYQKWPTKITKQAQQVKRKSLDTPEVTSEIATETTAVKAPTPKLKIPTPVLKLKVPVPCLKIKYV